MIKYLCDTCKKGIRNYRVYQGKFLCYRCYSEKMNMILNHPRNARKTLAQALEKTYEVKGYLDKRNNIRVILTLPQILVGHKIKLSLAK